MCEYQVAPVHYATGPDEPRIVDQDIDLAADLAAQFLDRLCVTHVQRYEFDVVDLLEAVPFGPVAPPFRLTGEDEGSIGPGEGPGQGLAAFAACICNQYAPKLRAAGQFAQLGIIFHSWYLLLGQGKQDTVTRLVKAVNHADISLGLTVPMNMTDHRRAAIQLHGTDPPRGTFTEINVCAGPYDGLGDQPAPVRDDLPFKVYRQAA